MSEVNRLHRHHILPVRLGGTEEESNLVYLTIREHAEAHLKLYEEHGDFSDYRAYLSLLAQDCEEYADWQKMRADFLRQPRSEETRRRMSEVRKGKIPWAATLASAKANKGRKRPDISAKQMGPLNWNYGSGVCSIPIEKRLEGLAKVTFEQKSARAKGKKWFTNGERDVRSIEAPEGFYPGRCRYSKSR